MKTIKGFEGLYEIAEDGTVKSLDRIIKHAKHGICKRKGIIIKTTPHKNGYKFVCLAKEGKTKLCTVHRLVAIAYIPNPNNYPIVMHLDNDPTNNHISNLQWGTHYMNSQHCVKSGRYRNQYSPSLS
jgi:hypothetical protein